MNFSLPVGYFVNGLVNATNLQNISISIPCYPAFNTTFVCKAVTFVIELQQQGKLGQAVNNLIIRNYDQIFSLAFKLMLAIIIINSIIFAVTVVLKMTKETIFYIGRRIRNLFYVIIFVIVAIIFVDTVLFMCNSHNEHFQEWVIDFFQYLNDKSITRTVRDFTPAKITLLDREF